MNYTGVLLKGSVIFMVGAVLAAVFAYATRIILANALSINEFGLFYAVLTPVLILLAIRDLGSNQAAAKFIAEFNILKQYGKISAVVISTFFFQLSISIIFAALLWFSADFLAQFYFQNVAAALLLKVSSLYLITGTLFTFIYSYLQGFKHPAIGLLDPAKSFCILVITLFLLPTFGVFAPASAYIIMPFILLMMFAVPMVYRFNIFKHKPRAVRKVFGKVFYFGLPLAVTGVGATVIGQIDMLMLTYFSTLELVGVYSVILPTAMVLMLFPSALGAFLMPIISELWNKKSFESISDGMNILYRYSFTFALPFLLALFFYADFFLMTFFGEPFLIGVIAFKILLVMIIIKYFVGISMQFLIGTGHAKTIMQGVLIGAGVNILLNFALIPSYGIVGAAIATGVSHLLIAWYFMKKIRTIISLHLNKIPSLVVSVLVFFLTMHIVKNALTSNIYLEIFASLSLGLIMYTLAVFLLRVITVEEIKRILKQI